MIHPQVKRLPENTSGRDFIVGDIHGCHRELETLLAAVDFDKTKDRCIAGGDLIDRGPSSATVVDLIDEDWFHSVRGNHDHWAVLALLYNHQQALHEWRQWGGTWMDEFSQERQLELADKLNTLPSYIIVGEGINRYNVVHAEFSTGVTDERLDLAEFSQDVLLNFMWDRKAMYAWNGMNPHYGNQATRPLPIIRPGLSRTYVGHNVVPRPIEAGTFVFLDGGCAYKNRGWMSQGSLIAACPQTKTFYILDAGTFVVTERPFAEVTL